MNCLKKYIVVLKNLCIGLFLTFTINSKSFAQTYTHSAGKKSYEIKNHLGDVTAVVSDVKVYQVSTGLTRANVQSISNYYPFGSEVPGRTLSFVHYRFGYNGMEKDNEIKGNSNAYTTMFRSFDPRVGRWLSNEFLASKYPSFTPYNFVLNNPINAVDRDGRDVFFVKDVDILKEAYSQLKRTELGKELLEKYEKSTSLDIYILEEELPLDRVGETERIKGFKQKIRPPGDEAGFKGVNVTKSERTGRDFDFVRFNTRYYEHPNGLGVSPQLNIINKIAAVIYHEIKAHIDLYNSSIPVDQQIWYEHNAFGYQISDEYTRQSGPRIGSFADRMNEQLLNLQKKDADDFKKAQEGIGKPDSRIDLEMRQKTGGYSETF